MVEVARTPLSLPKWRGKVIIHLKGGIWADLHVISTLWLPSAPHMVGRGLNLPEILCQKLWYAILTNRRHWKVSGAKKTLKWLIRPTSFWRFFAPCPLVDLRCGPGAMKILPDVPLAILKVTFFMVKVARTPPSSPKWRGMVIIHQKGGIWADFLAIFSILWLPRAPHMVGSGLSLPKILCQKFWYAILTTRRRWKVPQAKKIMKWLKNHPFFDVFLPPDRILDLQYGLMGHRCDRWSKISHTHSSGGGRGHIEASRASWVSHPIFTKGFYYITRKSLFVWEILHYHDEIRNLGPFFHARSGKIWAF